LQLPSEKMQEFKAKKIKILNESVDQLLQSVKSNMGTAEKEKKSKEQ
jgi:hypothetical protein